MTITEFMDSFELKNKDTVLKWINEGYIPGAKKDIETNEFFIPELSRPPYTKARAKTTDSIYKSIVKACIKRKGICAKLYKLSELEFQVYIQELSQAGYIRVEVQNNIKYYFATSKSSEFVKNSKPQKLLESCLGMITECTAKGITSACLEKVMT